MKSFPSLVVFALAFSLIFPPVSFAAEETGYTHITPLKNLEGSGEFVHGQAHGKLLIRVLMMGAIDKQGIHYFPENTNLLDAILYAGGIGETTKLDGVTIRRKRQKDLIEVELEELIEDGDPIPQLVDGDVVTLPWNWRKDISTITLITGFVSSLAAFGVAMVALTR